MAEAAALVALLGVLAFAVVRPRGLPEAVAAVPAAALLVALGVVSSRGAIAEARTLGSTLGFLAAVLVLADLSERAGLFRWAGSLLVAHGGGRPQRLLGLVFVVASVTTAVLSLDATVVLLTPVVVEAALAQRLRPKPHVYACTHLANSASLLLPVSNLTNLLALPASHLSFVRFALLMAGPQVVAVLVEYAVLRRFFAADLAAPARVPSVAPVPAPAYALAVLALTLAGFAVGPLAGVPPAAAAAGGAVLLAVRTRPRPRDVVAAASPAFLLFVLGLGIVVRGVTDHGLGRVVDALVPAGTSLPALLGVAAVGAVLANLVNNLPAVLLLLPAVAPAGPAAVLALLVGVDVGPNLTYVGSLATLLWRRVLRARDVEPGAVEFVRLGLLSVPLVLVGAVLTLWGGTRIWGGG